MRFTLTLRTAVGISILLLGVATPGFAQQGAAAGQWSYYAGDIGSTKYAPLDQINEDNVRRLRIAWRRPAVDQTILDRVPDLSYTRNLTATPLMVDGIGYTSNAVGLAEALDQRLRVLEQAAELLCGLDPVQQARSLLLVAGGLVGISPDLGLGQSMIDLGQDALLAFDIKGTSATSPPW